MKTIKFPRFQIRVPENESENFGLTGDAPKKVCDMVKELNAKRITNIPPIIVANMVKREIKKNFSEIY